MTAQPKEAAVPAQLPLHPTGDLCLWRSLWGKPQQRLWVYRSVPALQLVENHLDPCKQIRPRKGGGGSAKDTSAADPAPLLGLRGIPIPFQPPVSSTSASLHMHTRAYMGEDPRRHKGAFNLPLSCSPRNTHSYHSTVILCKSTESTQKEYRKYTERVL